MSLSSELISQFVKATKDTNKTKTETTVYGTIVYKDKPYVKLDGSDLLTPITTTAEVRDGERVTVLIKNHTAIVNGNVSSPSVRTSTVEEVVEQTGGEITRIDNLIVEHAADIESLNAKTAKIDELVTTDLTAANAKINKLETDYAAIENLDAENAVVKKLNATYAKVSELDASNADIDILKANYAAIENLDAENAVVNKLNATYATIARVDADKAEIDKALIKRATVEQLNATNANVDNLQADVADVNTLIFGSATGDSIHTDFANAVIAQLGNAQIKSAMIDSISADKIYAGSINTNSVQVMSEDGRLLISDETIQITDDNGVVRVQIGKDATNDYSINIWDAGGNLMFSEGGITDSAIKEAIIRNDMVREDANISASKLDIQSLFTEINNSTETIKSTRIFLDDKNQSLDVAFESMETEVAEQGEKIESQGTAISVVQGQIEQKIWQQDIDTSEETMNTKYSELNQKVDGMSVTVEEHASSINAVTDRVTNVEIGQDEIVMSITNITVGGRNLFLDTRREYSSNTHPLNTGNGYIPAFEPLVDGEQYTISVCVTPAPGVNYISAWFSQGLGTQAAGQGVLLYPNGTEKQVLSRTLTLHYYDGYTPEDNIKNSYLYLYRQPNNGTVTENTTIHWVKVEKGNKATDWTPAPEEVDQNINDVRLNADDNTSSITEIQQVIDGINTTIQNLVRDNNGTSLMTQTSDGWHFSIADTYSRLEGVSSSLEVLIAQYGGTDSLVQQLSESVNDLEHTAEYINIITYEDEPCIVLGESDSDYKLLITNTRIMFQVGSSVPTYIDSTGVITENIEIHNELKHEYFVTAIRENGNLGTKWMGGENLVKGSKVKATSSAYGFAWLTLPVALENETTYVLTVNGCVDSESANSNHKLNAFIFDTGWDYESHYVSISETSPTTKSITFTTGAEASNYTWRVGGYYYPNDDTVAGTRTINWYKLEKGETATPWCPHKDDVG